MRRVFIDPEKGDYRNLTASDREAVIADLLAVQLLNLPRDRWDRELARLVFYATGVRLVTEFEKAA